MVIKKKTSSSLDVSTNTMLLGQMEFEDLKPKTSPRKKKFKFSWIAWSLGNIFKLNVLNYVPKLNSQFAFLTN
jgi:hypothetical protein